MMFRTQLFVPIRRGVFVGFVNILAGRLDVVCIEHACQARGDEACLFELLPLAEAKGQTAVPFKPDPGLGRQLNLLELLFDRMPMGIAVLDREYRIQRYNPTWDDFSTSYAPSYGAPLVPGVSYFEHLPGTEPIIQPLFERTLDGETVRQNGIALELEGRMTFWDVVMTPLIEGDEVVGMLTVSIDATERVSLQQNLEQRVSARTQELQTLVDVAAASNSSLNMEEMLTKTLDLLVELVGASRAGGSLLDEETGEWKITILRPERDVDPAEMAKMLEAGQVVIDSGQMMYISPNVSEGFLEPGALLPLQIRERKLGVLAIIGRPGSRFSQDQLELFNSIAGQLSVAIENSYLYEKAEDMAVAAERNRLARELHDAVTQTLFSASLIADVLPRIWERDQEQGQKRLVELQELTRGALAEMRTLLLELRPATLTESSLADLLRQLTQAISGRSRLPVELIIEGERPLAAEIQIALYRIAQEGLNNISKHAAASEVVLKLTFQSQSVLLSIQDNGRGFDSANVQPHSLGLGIMRERAEKIGATLIIDSQIGKGTVIRVHCPLAGDKKGIMGEEKQINVFIVDDHAVVRSGLAAFLSVFDDLQLVGEAGSGAEALQKCQETAVDVVLMDLMMPEMDGAETTRLIRQQCPWIQVIALTSFPEEKLVQDALKAGAISYLLKNVTADELAAAIRAAHWTADLGS